MSRKSANFFEPLYNTLSMLALYANILSLFLKRSNEIDTIHHILLPSYCTNIFGAFLDIHSFNEEFPCLHTDSAI